ncbi:MAG: triose-phosphate isomerase [Planctomycetes bacterium]|nr:triose-phosphate isomerase [Planctomycetota bacterium]MBV20780.1 triose-phosphate isomerase [Planctomycetaceae bacterium]HJM57316.1 triose-phosphate isomerase [Planctomycetota bacterium]
MRKPFIAGNWKMNLERSSAIALAKAVCESVGARDDVDVGLFPPAVYLRDIVEAAQSSPVQVGAQNCCDQVGGAHTGEISVSMVQDVGSGLVLLGHSERRHVYGESDELINRKVHTALAQGLDVMLCLGETQEQREAGETEAVCGSQLQAGLAGVGVEDLQRVTLAYEPVWAIGTGLTASPEQAQDAHAYVRGVLAGIATDDLAARTRILYGGSVKGENAADLLARPDIDGALVGGASLTPEAFLPIIPDSPEAPGN